MSKEHIWSDWLSNVIPQTEKHGQHTIHSKFNVLEKTVYVQPFLPASRQGSLNQRKIRKVCIGCNGGWMREIVDKAKPSAIAMIRGESTILPWAAQKSLAAWISIASIMAEFTDPITAGVPASDRKWLYEKKTAPENWTICLGIYSGKQWSPMRYRHHGGAVVTASLPWPAAVNTTKNDNLQVTTHALGRLVIHAFSSTSAELVSGFRQRWIPKGMLSIWPITTDLLNWPSTVVLDDAAMLDIANGWEATFTRTAAKQSASGFDYDF